MSAQIPLQDADLFNIRYGAEHLNQEINLFWTKTFTREESQALGELIGDLNPVHTDPVFAQSVGFQTTFAHGVAVFGEISRAGARRFREGTMFKEIKITFKRPFFHGRQFEFQIKRFSPGKRTIIGVEADFYFAAVDSVTRKEHVSGMLKAFFPNKAPKE